jgi:predicted glycoside hydrolase/deacetylase ChbG (UPF0249 family)
VRAADIVAEIGAQFARFRALHPTGAGPAYVDGHQHVQVLPVVASALCCLLEEEGSVDIAVRIPDLGAAEAEDVAGLPPVRRAFYEAVSADCSAARATFARVSVRVAAPPAFIGYTTMGAASSVARVLGVLGRLAAAPAAEWMTHPGLQTFPLPRPPGSGGAGCGDGPDDFALSSEREVELAVLCDPALQEGLAAAGWAPTAFKVHGSR